MTASDNPDGALPANDNLDGDLPDQAFNPLLGAQVAATPNAPAVIDDNGSTSWTQLDERSVRLVLALRERGLVPGDHIVAVMGNTAEFIELSLACCVGGFVLIPLNWHWVAAEIAYVIDDARPVAIFADARFAAGVGDALASSTFHVSTNILVSTSADGVDPAVGSPTKWDSYEAFLRRTHPGPLADPCKGGPMFYTSGTTGQPKGVRSMLTSVGGPADLFVLMAHATGPTIDVDPATANSPEHPTTQLICGPMYHSAQWVFALFSLLCGARLVLQHRFDAAGVLDLIDRHKVTNIHLVPTQIKRILGLSQGHRDSFSGASLRSVLHGAAPCPPSVKRELIHWWGPVVSEYYGGTEGGFISKITASEWLERPTSVGRALPVIELQIIGTEGEPMSTGETGEVWFRNLLGSGFKYHNAPDKTKAAHRNDGASTLGDVGFIDSDGYLHLADRKIDMIVSGGVNIYPAEVEAVLTDHPDVADAAVFGIPDDQMGEAVHAVVVLAGSAALDPTVDSDLQVELDDWCRERMAGYKRPRSYEAVGELPRTDTGKLLKRELRQPWWAERDRLI